MNKYQKAVDTLKGFLEDEWKDMQGWCNEVIPENLDILQELVNKETPMKAKNIYKTALGLYTGTCPYCNEFIVEGTNYCRRTGKRLEFKNE